MRRTIVFGTLTIASAFGVALIARGDAPKDQYDLFQMSTPIIHDQQSGLDWERYPEAADAGGGMLNHMSADTRCKNMGWRLPTVKELLTLVDEEPHAVYFDGATSDLYIDRNAFPFAAADEYWTSSQKAGDTAFWTVDFSTGLIHDEKPGTPRWVRCVRPVGAADAGSD